MKFTKVPYAGHFREGIMNTAPPFLSGEWGGRFLYSIGIQLDAIAEMLRMGVDQRFPDLCQAEALQYIGADRVLRRGGAEPSSGYRDRLRKAFKSWKKAGSPIAVLEQLAAYFAPTPPRIRYVVNGQDENGSYITDWWTLENGVYTYTRANPSNWDWDGYFPVGRFWIIVYGGVLTPWYWGDGHTWGGGQSWGFDGPGAFIQDIRSLVATWKAAGSHAGTYSSGLDAGLIFTNDDTAFDPASAPGDPGMPDGTWADPLNRNPNALYLSGI
jgi:hypothetical protein